MSIWRKALFPFQMLFAGAVVLRKQLYKCGVFSRYVAPVPTIVIGNLSTGGTGKTPMVDYLLCHFSKNQQLAMLSRGYGRQTKGFVGVEATATAAQVGDEPLMLAQKHPDVHVAVCENRPLGIEKMLQQHPSIAAFFLDDALQHLALKPTFKIVLTTFQNPWFEDKLLPVGNLRETASAATAADIVVVTKCPPEMNPISKKDFKSKLRIAPHQHLFFTSLDYDTHVNGVNTMAVEDFIKTPFVLLTGIANPTPLVSFLKDKNAKFTHRSFPDHHRFSDSEIAALKALKKPILTTEKDAARLASYDFEQLHTIGVKAQFLEHEKQFLKLVQTALNG